MTVQWSRVVLTALAIVTALSLSKAQILQDKGCCVAFALDESTSMTESQFQETTLFTSFIINTFKRYGLKDGQRAAVITFATRVNVIFGLDGADSSRNATSKVLGLLLGGGLTYTHLALNTLGTLLPSCDPGYNKAGVVITDGNPTFERLTEEAADRFKSQYTLILVGVGSDIRHAFMEKLATLSTLYYRAPSFAALRNLSIEISNVVCSEPKITTTTTPTTTTTTPTTTTTTPTTTTTTPTTTTTTPTTTTTTPTTTTTTPTTTTTTPTTTTTTTPTTTTTTPTTTTFTVTPVPTTGECLKCEYINGLYIFPDSEYCYVFHSCINYYQAFATLRPCPFGQFFDKDAATCRPASALDCPTDPCKDSNVVSYPNFMICGAYFECKEGRTFDEKCCAAGQRFLQGQGCVADATCKDACPPKARDPECFLREIDGDNTKYQENLGGGIWKTRDCASGTRFFIDDCRCSQAGPPDPDPDCKDSLNLPFTRNVQDIRLRKYVTNNRPRVKIVQQEGASGGRAAQFTGNDRLLVKGYGNSWWGNKLVIRTRFLESNRSPLASGVVEVLFGNGDCGPSASVTAKYDRANNRVNAKLVTVDSAGNENTYRTSVAPVSAGSWKDVELRYDGQTFRLTVDNDFDSTPAIGNIAKRQAALQIASGCPENAEFYTGYQDDFRVFNCLP